MPSSRIDAASSSSAVSSNVRRGWSGFGDIWERAMSLIADVPRAGVSSIEISVPNPLPSAFLCVAILVFSC